MCVCGPREWCGSQLDRRGEEGAHQVSEGEGEGMEGKGREGREKKGAVTGGGEARAGRRR